MRKLLLIITLLVSQMDKGYAIPSGGGNCDSGGGGSKPSANYSVVLNRTFSKVQQAPITITQSDLQTAFAFGKLRITNEIKGPIQANVGNLDLINAQTWSIPFQTFTQVDTSIVIQPATTPYYSAFPNSQIAIEEYRKSCVGCNDYEYYSFSASGVNLNGLVSYLDTTGGFEMEVDTMNILLSNLPASVNTNFLVNDTIEDFDTTVFVKGYIKTEGFGNIIASDGSNHQVLKTVNLFHFLKNGNNTYEKAINFISNDGYSLSLYLSDTTVTNGLANVKEMEEMLLKSKTITSISATNSSAKELIVYPNPSSHILKIENAGGSDITVIDMLGKVVLKVSVNLTGSSLINIGNLQSGVYTIKTNNQQIKFIKRD